MNPTDITKRNSLKALAGVLGLGLSASHINALAAFKPQNAGGVLKLFSPAQLAGSAELAELVIPATDTPGAKAAGVHYYLDHHLSVCSPKAQQESVLQLLDQLDAIAQAEHRQVFARVSSGQRKALVEKLHASKAPFSADHHRAWRYFISLVVFAYYTSEIGATEELNYLAIPGGYDGDLPFSEAGRAWSLQPFV